MAGRLPDFIIAGAPRSGTSWLYRFLDGYPDIYMARPVQPEPKFFLVDELYRKGIGYYSDTWFAETGSARLCGEKSTNYMESPVVAERLSREVPGVRLIFVLRDPVERCYSNYLWSRMNSLEDRGFAEALALETERERGLAEDLRYVRPHAYFSRGLYADMLEPFFKCFPKERILCLRFEDIRERLDRFVARLEEFLGVILRAEDARAIEAVNPSAKDPGEMPGEVREALGQRYAKANTKLTRLLGPDFEGWRHP